MALEVKRLVHAEGYTIAGARTVLEQGVRKHGSKLNPQAALPLAGDQPNRMDAIAAAIGHARAELREIAGMLGSSAQQPARRRSRLAPIRAAASGSLFPS
jgi:hypothetical protein